VFSPKAHSANSQAKLKALEVKEQASAAALTLAKGMEEDKPKKVAAVGALPWEAVHPDLRAEAKGTFTSVLYLLVSVRS
jgi:hypothetical protein